MLQNYRAEYYHAFCLIILLVFAPASKAWADSVVFRGLSVEEFQPDLPWSGRVNGIAINPDFPDVVHVVTDSGGLFESRNQGGTWRHVDALPVKNLSDVAYFRSDSRVIIVTAEADFRILSATGSEGTVESSGGGIWISRDRGETWDHVDAAVPRANVRFPMFDRSCPFIFSAFDISVDSDSRRVFVATDCGLLYTDDLGESWVHDSVNPGFSFSLRQFTTVSALEGPGVILGGASGVWFSDDNGGSWNREETGIGPTSNDDVQGSSRVVGRPRAAYIVTEATPPADANKNDTRKLWHSMDNGRTWTEVVDIPRRTGACGGNAHVRAFVNPRSSLPFGSVDDVYFGNTCRTYRRTTSAAFVGFDIWARLEGSHGDTRDIEFYPGSRDPVFLGSDGGLDRSQNGQTWRPVGSGPGKINALQLYDVEGQQVLGPGSTYRYHLAIGTQDNDLWASADGGFTWPVTQRARAEGGNIEMRRSIGEREFERWTYYACAGCVRQISDPLFRNQQNWPGYASRPGCGFGWTKKFGNATALNGIYVHSVDDASDKDMETCDVTGKTLELATDFGASFFPLWTVPSGVKFIDRPSVTPPGVIYSAITRGSFSIDDGFDPSWNTRDTELVRIAVGLGAPPLVSYPAMNGFGSLGYRGFQFEWPPIYEINPRDPRHIIAPDVENGKMMVTKDGGESWTEIIGLANAVTRGGKYRFVWPRLKHSSHPFSLVSAIRFFPENSELVVLGLYEGGAYISGNGGESWNFVPGSDRINNITDFHWRSANYIYVSSYGRGLWRILFDTVFTTSDLIPALGGFNSSSDFLNGIEFGPELYMQNLDPGPIRTEPLVNVVAKSDLVDSLVLAVNGPVDLSGKSKAKLGAPIAVVPGASLLSFSVDGDPQSFKSLEPIDLKNQGGVLVQNTDAVPVGVGYKSGKAVGIIFGNIISYKLPLNEPIEFEPDQPDNPPGYEGGYFVIAETGSAFMSDVYFDSDDLTIRGYSFEGSGPIDILIDGSQIGKSLPDDDGSFIVKVPLRGLSVGPHKVLVRQPDSQDDHLETIYIAPQDFPPDSRK